MNFKINNKPIIFKDNNFQSIQIRLFFPFKKDNNLFACVSLLPNILNSFNNKYRSEKQFKIMCQKLYILSLYCSVQAIGDTFYYVMNLVIPNKDILKKNLYDKQFNLFREMIYNPKIKNNSFLKKDIEREISNIKLELKEIDNNIYSYSMIKMKEIIDDSSLLSSCLYNNQEQLDYIDGEKLYKHYLDTIYNNMPLIYIMGDVDSNEMNLLCNKYLYIKHFSNSIVNINIKNYLLCRNNVNIVREKSSFNNSFIAYIYKVKDMSFSDEILLSTLSDLLSSSTCRLLNKKLRDENDLVYGAYAINYNNFGVFGIVAFINRKNENVVKDKILEVLNDLKNDELVSSYLDKLKEKYRLNLERNLDNKYYVFSEKIIDDLKIYDTSIDHYNKFINIKANDILNFLDRLVLDTIYFLEEEYE